jgi:hypothetical protein
MSVRAVPPASGPDGRLHDEDSLRRLGMAILM